MHGVVSVFMWNRFAMLGEIEGGQVNKMLSCLQDAFADQIVNTISFILSKIPYAFRKTLPMKQDRR